MKTLASIIIPCFNYSQYISKTLDSVIKQTYTNWECIIVDDGSTDNTKEIVQEYVLTDSRIKYFYQRNQGQPVARNMGIESSTGSYVQFLDADDIIEPNKIEQQVNFLINNPSVDIVYGEVKYFLEDPANEILLYSRNSVNAPWMPEISGKGEEMIQAFVKENIMELGCALFRREAIKSIGFFDKALRGVEDWDFCIRAAFANKKFCFFSIEDGAVLMRHHSDSFSKNRTIMMKITIELRKKINDWIENSNKYLHLKEINNRYTNKLIERLAVSEFESGSHFKAIYLLVHLGIKKKNLLYYIKKSANLFIKKLS